VCFSDGETCILSPAYQGEVQADTAGSAVEIGGSVGWGLGEQGDATVEVLDAAGLHGFTAAVATTWDEGCVDSIRGFRKPGLVAFTTEGDC
jgi:hypothetical protein